LLTSTTGYTTYDAAAGISKDNSNVQVFGQNLTDTRGSNFISQSVAIETEAVIRPRVRGVRLGYKFCRGAALANPQLQ
jgi:hypothetical protein